MKGRLTRAWSRITGSGKSSSAVSGPEDAAQPRLKIISLGVPVDGADLVLGTTNLEPLSQLPDDSVELIKIDDFALNDVDVEALFRTLYRIIAAHGVIRFGFGSYHIGLGGASDDEIAVAVARFVMLLARLGFVVEVLQQAQSDIFVPVYPEDGGRLNRSRKWTVDSESFKATTLLLLRPGVLEVGLATGDRRVIKRRDHHSLREALSGVLTAGTSLPEVQPLLDALAGSDHAFEDASAAAFVDFYAPALLDTNHDLDRLTLLLQTLLRSDFCGRVSWESVDAFMRRHQQRLQESLRFSNLAVTLLQRIGGTAKGDHWATAVYRSHPRYRTYEPVFIGHVMGALASKTGKTSPSNDGPAFDPDRDIFLDGLGKLGRFGNQLTQFAYATCAASALGLRVRTPRWIGSYLFAGQESAALFTRPDCVATSDAALRKALLAGEAGEVAGRSVTGFFNFNFGDVAGARHALEASAQPDPAILEQIARIEPDVLGERAFIGVHVRRGDFGYGRFRLTPEAIFEERVNDPAFRDMPIMLVTDAAEGELVFSDAFQDRLIRRPVHEDDVMQLVADWLLLGRAAVLMHANSTFSFSAALMSRSPSIFRPNGDYSALVPYDPWASLPFFG